jgi:hypothetical protein
MVTMNREHGIGERLQPLRAELDQATPVRHPDDDRSSSTPQWPAPARYSPERWLSLGGGKRPKDSEGNVMGLGDHRLRSRDSTGQARIYPHHSGEPLKSAPPITCVRSLPSAWMT